MTSRPEGLPQEVEDRLDELEDLRVLGATRQLGILADALTTVVENHEGKPEDIARTTRELSNYLIATRGQASRAIGNTLSLMLSDLEEEARGSMNAAEFQEWLLGRIEDYKIAADRWVEALTEYGANLLSGCWRVLAYDYSSSVSRIFRVASARGQSLSLILPEARALDGGRKYLAELESTAHTVEIVPDVAVGAMMRDCDVALAGAETITAEGGCYNTIGTFQTALAARYWGKSFYVASTSIKMDTETLYGRAQDIPTLPLGGKLLDAGEAVDGKVSASCPELDYTPPALIHGFVTERGVIPPAALHQLALRLSKRED